MVVLVLLFVVLLVVLMPAVPQPRHDRGDHEQEMDRRASRTHPTSMNPCFLLFFLVNPILAPHHHKAKARACTSQPPKPHLVT